MSQVFPNTYKQVSITLNIFAVKISYKALVQFERSKLAGQSKQVI